MSHVLTRTRAVVGGGILAVLLLACFSVWSQHTSATVDE